MRRAGRRQPRRRRERRQGTCPRPTFSPRHVHMRTYLLTLTYRGHAPLHTLPLATTYHGDHVPWPPRTMATTYHGHHVPWPPRTKVFLASGWHLALISLLSAAAEETQAAAAAVLGNLSSNPHPNPNPNPYPNPNPDPNPDPNPGPNPNPNPSPSPSPNQVLGNLSSATDFRLAMMADGALQPILQLLHAPKLPTSTAAVRALATMPPPCRHHGARPTMAPSTNNGPTNTHCSRVLTMATHPTEVRALASMSPYHSGATHCPYLRTMASLRCAR